MADNSLFEKLGGYPMFRKINKIFYDKVYADPWMKQFFSHVPQEHIENQQTDFMAAAFGGPEQYSGRLIPDAHQHIHITEELFLLREKLLDEAFVEAGAPSELVTRWKKIDNAFKKGILKSKEECVRRFATDSILSFENPDKSKKSA